VSAGVSAMGEWHGGAIEEAAKLLQDGVTRVKNTSLSMEIVAEEILLSHRDSDRRISGYGHPTHTNDPRTKRLLEIADQNHFHGDHVGLALMIERLTEKIFNKHLILNVDGCKAAIISDMGF